MTAPATRAPLVSVVVPTHDRAGMLPRLLRSVLAQRLDDPADLELLVVDDGSRDRTQQVLAACPDPRLRVLRHGTAQGVAAARNTGTRAARGRWVAWCDDDDVWAPDKLRLQLAALAAQPGALWCNGGSAYVDEDLRLSRTRRCPPAGDALGGLLRVNTITGGGSGVLADRALAVDVGGFDGRFAMFADWVMWVRLAERAPLAVVDYPLVGYCGHPGGMSRARLDLAFAELTRFTAELERVARRNGRAEQLAGVPLGNWMLRQQTGGRRLQSLLLPFRLVRRRMMRPVKAVPYALLAGLTPDVLHRRWSGQWLLDRRSMDYARTWLDELRGELPALQPA